MSDHKAREFLQTARKLILSGASEAVVRNSFEQHLPLIFPDLPWWVKWHATGAETHTKFNKGGSQRYGFVDTLIGATPVEYEPNLAKVGVEEHAKDQIRDYIAGEINKGVSIDIIVGIVSDTVRWRAYRPSLADEAENNGTLSGENILLDEIDAIDLMSPSLQDGRELKRFLLRHLGRVGARPLRGEMLANDLGLDSQVGGELRSRLDAIERAARARRPGYGKLIDRLWSELVDTIGKKGSSKNLGLAEYLDEFFLLTLAKLICANVLSGVAVNRSDDEIAAILDGSFFAGRGLQNYVEYDLFGWLSENPSETGMLEVARAIQDDLVAYDFGSIVADDLFGQLLARLGRRSTRLILGQELTPPWLAAKIVQHVAAGLKNVPLRLVDTACGSGTIIVEAIREEAGRQIVNESATDRARRIAASATGFDIDPLAALFAKTNWVISMRDELPHLGEITIPVFHADSLFAGLYERTSEKFVLKLDDSTVIPPKALLNPSGRVVFDHLLSSVYRIAMREAEGTGEPDISSAKQIARAAIRAAANAAEFDEVEIAAFAGTLIRELALLQRDGRNGLWSYVIRNTSRAAQSFAQFNAMAINPPWLALSKISGNPYGNLLDRLADELGVRPAGQSFLHTELSAVFLLEGVRRYLEPEGRFGCILPSTIAEGHHQNRFRTGAYANSRRQVALDVDEIWSVPTGVFKNEAIVLFGSNDDFQLRDSIEGRTVGPDGDEEKIFRVVTAEYQDRPNRVVWTASEGDDLLGFGFNPAAFRQGADLMPRTAWFHDFKDYGADRSQITPITSSSKLWYLLREAKVGKEFRLKTGLIIDNAFLVEAILSNQLSPFVVAPADKMLIPAVFSGTSWRTVTDGDLAGMGQGTNEAFEALAKTFDCDLGSLFAKVDVRGKLTRQAWDDDSYIVLSGAGGANPCAAWVPPGTYFSGESVFDQTVYWAPVATLQEAAYLAGAVNSPTCAALIQPFQPRGQQGRRHIHKLPFAVTPPYDDCDESHVELAEATIGLEAAWKSYLHADVDALKRTLPTFSKLQSRRTWASRQLRSLPEWARYEEAGAALFGGL